MQNPTESSIPANGPNLNRTFTVHRKAAKRSEPWYQNTASSLSIPARKKPRREEPTRRSGAMRVTGYIGLEPQLPWYLASPSPQPQEGDIAVTLSIPARKKPRTQEPLPTTPDEAAISVGLPPPAADKDDANAEPVTDTQPNAGGTRATGLWTPEEDAELTSAVSNACKKKWGKGHTIDWVAVAALVPSRTNIQCRIRWHFAFDPNIALTAGRKGNWTKDEDIKLKGAVRTHGGKNWDAIAARVPGRTKKQCTSRWHDVLDPSIDRANGRNGKWTADEDIKLKDAVQMYGGKDWVAIATLVSGRTNIQCHNRWHDILIPRVALTVARKGRWAEDEDIKLEYAVQMHGDKDWVAIAALVPGRTKKQCWNRWTNCMDPNRSTDSPGKRTRHSRCSLSLMYDESIA
jgi:hypothetical protein